MIHTLIYGYFAIALVIALFLIWAETMGPWKMEKQRARQDQKSYPKLLKEGNDIDILILLLRYGRVDIEDLHSENYEFPKTLSLDDKKGLPIPFQIAGISLMWPVTLSAIVLAVFKKHREENPRLLF